MDSENLGAVGLLEIDPYSSFDRCRHCGPERLSDSPKVTQREGRQMWVSSRSQLSLSQRTCNPFISSKPHPSQSPPGFWGALLPCAQLLGLHPCSGIHNRASQGPLAAVNWYHRLAPALGRVTLATSSFLWSTWFCWGLTVSSADAEWGEAERELLRGLKVRRREIWSPLRACFRKNLTLDKVSKESKGFH